MRSGNFLVFKPTVMFLSFALVICPVSWNLIYRLYSTADSQLALSQKLFLELFLFLLLSFTVHLQILGALVSLNSDLFLLSVAKSLILCVFPFSTAVAKLPPGRMLGTQQFHLVYILLILLSYALVCEKSCFPMLFFFLVRVVL